MPKFFSVLTFMLLVSIQSFAQQIVNPFDSHRNEFNQRDFISVINDPSNSVKQQILGYDWIRAFSQNAWSNIDTLSPQTTMDNASDGYIVIKTGKFNGNNKDDVFYLVEHQNRWTYGVAEQTQQFDNADSMYHYQLNIPTMVQGDLMESNHSYPVVTIGDFDGNGTVEAAVAWTEGTNRDLYLQIVAVSYANGAFTVTPEPKLNTNEICRRFSNTDGIAITSGDFNGDGTDEIMVSGIEDNTTNPDVEYNAYAKVFDVSTDGNFTLIPKGKVEFDDSSMLANFNNESVDYARTTVAAVRSYPTQEPTGGIKSVFAALGIHYPIESTGDNFNYLNTYKIDISPDLQDLSVTTGPKINTQISHLQFLSPFESHVGNVNDDITDDIVLLTDRFTIFTFQDGNLVIGNNGNLGLTTPILDFPNNPYQESCERFDIGDINRDGIDDIICQTKTYNGSIQNYYIQAFQTHTEITNNDTNSFVLNQSGAYNFQVESGQSTTNYGFALGNLDGNDLHLGAPIVHNCTYYKPEIMLDAMPYHFDVINGQPFDLNSAFGGADNSGNIVQYVTADQTSDHSAVTVSSDWSVSESASSSLALGGFTMGASISHKYGEHFSNTNTSGITQAFQVTINVTLDDELKIAYFPFTMNEYPVLDDGGDTTTWIVAAFPNPNGEVNQDFENSKTLYNYIPNHEVGNLLSYPKPSDPDFTADHLSDDASVPWQIFSFPTLTVSFSGNQNPCLTNQVASGFENSSEVSSSLTAGIDMSGFGLGASLEGNYSQSTLKVFGQEMSTAETFCIYFGALQNVGTNTWEYQVKPMLYWNQDRAVELGMAVDFSNAGASWYANYGQLPDPALNLPYLHENLTAPNNYDPELLDRTRSVYFDKINPNPGDTVTAYIRIFNYSLLAMTQPVPFAMYIGDPNNGGTPIEDLNGNTLFSTGINLQDQGRTTVPVSFIVTPEMINQKVYIQLDPNNEITEIHEGNNLGWTDLGFTCNSPSGSGSSNSLAESPSLEKIKLYPNPANKSVTLDFSALSNKSSDRISIALYDLSGKMQYQKTLSGNGSGENRIDVSHLSAGIYMVQLSTAERVIYTGKLAVEP